MINFQGKIGNDSFSKYLWVVCYILIIPILLFVIKADSITMEKSMILVWLIPTLLFLSLNFKASFVLLIASIFIQLNFYYFYFAEIIAIFTILSFFITHKIKVDEFKNDINRYFFTFILLLIPSYLNSDDKFNSIFLSWNLVAFFFVFNIVAIKSTNYKEIRKVIYLYLCFALLNGFTEFYEFIETGARVFGVAGIMYVDLVSVALIITLTMIFYQKKNRYIKVVVFMILLLAEIFTQTRGVWICTIATILLLIINFIVKSKSLGYNRNKVIISTITIVALIVVTVLVINSVAPEAYSRVKGEDKTAEELSETPLAINSFASRMFIWSTAFNAFKAHPITGIGIYAFRFVSQKYATIDPNLYDIFVKGLVPHTMVLAILSELGIIGAFGFLYFFIRIIRFSAKNIKNSRTEDQLLYSEIIFWVYIYMCFSMVMTDAWLWGNCLLVWGIFNGLSVANRRLIEQENEETSNVNNLLVE